jgi:hypothetical protein
VPRVIRDFPITRHEWAFPAAVLARYFSSTSLALGVEFRSFSFASQRDFNTGDLRQYGEKFDEAHQLKLPPDVDPDGALKAQVQADFDLGLQIKLEYVAQLGETVARIARPATGSAV